MTRTFGLLILMITGVSSLSAAEPPFPPTRFSGAKAETPLVELLDSLAKQSGIAIDSASIPKGKTWKPRETNRPFWDLLQAIAEQEQCRVELNGSGDRVTFVPRGSAPPPQVSTSGPFRLALKSVSSKLDLDSGRHLYDLGVDLCWEPRIRVFRVSHLKSKASSQGADQPQTIEDATKVNVSGCHHRLNLKMQNIARAVPQLETVNGSVTVTAAEKMLRVAFEELATTPSKKTVDQVDVTLAKWGKFDDLWEARVELKYPAGMPEFESFESEIWLRDNVCRLVSPDRTKSFESKDFQVRIVPGGAVIDYRFPEDKARGLLPAKGWILEVETPSPLVEFPVEFNFKNVKLP